jgi:hypothetical protein
MKYAWVWSVPWYVRREIETLWCYFVHSFDGWKEFNGNYEYRCTKCGRLWHWRDIV